MESTIFSLLASSLLVGLPSVVILCGFLLIYIGMLKRKMVYKENLPSIITTYIVQCLNSITNYWENIVPQARFYRVHHDFIVFQCMSIVFTLKLVEFLKSGDKSSKELALLTNTSERNIDRLMKLFAKDGNYFTTTIYNSSTNTGVCTTEIRYGINKKNLGQFEQKYFLGMTLDRNQISPDINNQHLKQLKQQQQNNQNNQNKNIEQQLNNQPPQQQQQQNNQNNRKEIMEWNFNGKEECITKIFEAAMHQKSELNRLHQHLSSTYNFSKYRYLCDIGGGFGYLGFHIARTYRSCDVVVLEMEEAVKHGIEIASNDTSKKALLDENRITFRVGDMFQPRSIPRANAYLLMQILTVWQKSDCIRILSSINSVMRKELLLTGRSPTLVIIDYVVDDPPFGLVSSIIADSANSDNSVDEASNEDLVNQELQILKDSGNTSNESHQSLTSSDVVMIGIVGQEKKFKSEWEQLFKEAGLVLQSLIKIPPCTNQNNLALMELIVL